ncbi:SAM-dependent DNA methyltransferase [Antarcticibacterium flavum]|uniref:site-specific DNA-methyltransferase (adenine-specific) n=1 Tax=Antarcticibacterium flavum TaxID=2058175 RepID=A0A5B7X1X5_9FLAO|nr:MULTISPECIES: N-6 DNA methylase [Antarcticibacterium]MCM4161327.1 hypothetical protein [Antarcticibacterium sp. W02-3]QCY69407.1 SAM-dependent DNA methyltransferase [Antarcticibacterium flavum]
MFNTISKPYINDDVVKSFEEQLELFFSNDFKTKSETPAPDENLGQVFTSPILAKFMVSLFKKNKEINCSILDPCIGPNTFFKALPLDLANCNLKGIEIDKNLINDEIESFFSGSKRTLIQGSFFDLPISEKFDLIIQNPPYVRQELLRNGVNSKRNIKNNFLAGLTAVPSQSNLYIYFLLKSIVHLKDNGEMVAVIYDSWLYSSFGNFLKDSFLKLGSLQSIYHFKKSAFENVDVGATVIKFVKDKNKSKSFSYHSLKDLNDLRSYNDLNFHCQRFKQHELLTHSFNNESAIDFKLPLFKTLKSIVSQPIQRGTSAIINQHFIFTNNILPELKPIIKDISQIKTYSVYQGNAYVLAVSDTTSCNTKEYLDVIRNKILNSPPDKYKAVKNKILSGKNWFKIKTKSSGNFIFNYYLRNNVDFILNPNKCLSSDNFYNLSIPSSELVYLAILNSTFTRLNVLSNSRSQGNGLRKIQLYEFKEVKVVDVKNLSNQTSAKLNELGEKLLSVNRYQNEQQQIIEQIDNLLLNEYNEQYNSSFSLNDLKKELKEYYN